MSNFPVNQDPKEKQAILIECAHTSQLLAIRYRDKDNNVTDRTIEPYEIKDGRLYGYCLNRQGIRAFALRGILSAVGTDTSFAPRFPIRTVSFYETPNWMFQQKGGSLND